MANKNSNHTIGINKISFYTLVAMAVLYLISTVLKLFNLALKIIPYLQGIATAIAICILGVLAWRFVDSKPTAWKVLYIIVLLVVIVGVIIPMI
ncbi:MAG: hypothetical protein E7345_02860 [Clostridiales bacterium]|nr:hypothetical protein [Clostridiales bacterium]